jgi:hypothetical protein
MLMLTIFWDSQGPILETYLESGTTVTSATYCDVLQGGVKPAICSKRRGRLSEVAFVLYSTIKFPFKVIPRDSEFEH